MRVYTQPHNLSSNTDVNGKRPRQKGRARPFGRALCDVGSTPQAPLDGPQATNLLQMRWTAPGVPVGEVVHERHLYVDAVAAQVERGRLHLGHPLPVVQPYDRELSERQRELPWNDGSPDREGVGAAALVAWLLHTALVHRESRADVIPRSVNGHPAPLVTVGSLLELRRGRVALHSHERCCPIHRYRREKYQRNNATKAKKAALPIRPQERFHGRLVGNAGQDRPEHTEHDCVVHGTARLEALARFQHDESRLAE